MKSTMVLAVILSLPGPGFADDNGSDTGWQYERRQNDGERTMGDEARRFPAPENGDENRGYGEGDNRGEWGNDGNRGDGEYGNQDQGYGGENQDGGEGDN